MSRTYKDCDGCAPMFAYIGREGYLADLELREGKQHSQKGIPEFLKEMTGICRQMTEKPLLFRLDSGDDSAENIGVLMENGCHFIVKRNLRKEDWLKMAEENSGDVSHPRNGKTPRTQDGDQYYLVPFPYYLMFIAIISRNMYILIKNMYIILYL